MGRVSGNSGNLDWIDCLVRWSFQGSSGHQSAIPLLSHNHSLHFIPRSVSALTLHPTCMHSSHSQIAGGGRTEQRRFARLLMPWRHSVAAA